MNLSAKRYLPHVLIFAFAFLLYGNTLTYDYTLDDLIVIKDNAFTKKGVSGIKEIFSYDSFTGFFGIEKKLVAGGRYRPLSIASFAVEYSLMGGLNPFASHLINILLYALTGSFMFLVLSGLLKSSPKDPWYAGIPFIASALFMAHPIHTEVVANIKGRDEIFALLFSLIAVWLTLRHFDTKKSMLLLGANIFFFLGLLSKENAIVFAVIIPVTIYYFTKVPLKRNLIVGLSFLFTALVFVFIRFLVLGYLNSGELPRELLNNPFLEATTGQKYGTILYTLGLYIKLLFFPHPLTHDYYPYHIPLVQLTDWRALTSLVMYAGMIVYAMMHLKAKSIISYGIFFYLLTLFIVSNLLFPVGTFMNERFIYMPSAGFTLIIAFLFVRKLPLIIKNPRVYHIVVSSLLLFILMLFTIRTYTRNQVWKDNFTLFSSDVKISVNSVKCNVSAGGDYQKKAGQETDTVKKTEYYELSLMYLKKAIAIYPKASNGLLLYGNVLTLYKKDYKQSIAQYLKILEFDLYNTNAVSNTLQVLGSLDNAKESDYKIGVLTRLYAISPDNPDVNYSLGKQYGQFRGNLDSAAYFLERSVSLNPENPGPCKDLGIVYSMKGDFNRALEIFSRAQKLDPSDQQVRQNIQLTRQIMNQNNR
jgi:tetratricopeptide (TPR) repeat protein